jgi:selenocysteine-specific elongation factor
VHVGTAAVDGTVSRSGRNGIDLPDGTVAAILRPAVPIAVAEGDRFVLRRTAGVDRVVGGLVLDTAPPRGTSRRRLSTERVVALAAAATAADRSVVAAARLELHGAAVSDGRAIELAADVAEHLDAEILASIATTPVQPLPAVRSFAARVLRRHVTLDPASSGRAAADAVDRLVAQGRLARDGDRVQRPGSGPDRGLDSRMVVAMDRLERALAVAAPPSLATAAAATGCPAPGVRELERAGRIVLLEPDLAYAATTYGGLVTRALALAAESPLTPAAFRDATGTSRRYVVAILEDLDRRGILRRTTAGHVPGPRAAVGWETNR